MTRDELRTRVRKLTGILMTTLLTDTEVNAALNHAYLYLASLGQWTFQYAEELVASVADQAVYALPGSIKTPRTVSLSAPSGSRTSLVFRRPDELDRYPSHAIKGDPWAWTVEDDANIRIFPAPAAGLTIRVRGIIRPPEMALAGDTPIFPSEYHMAIAYEASQRLLTEEGDDSGRADFYRQQVIATLMSMGARFILDDPELPARAYAGSLTEPEDTEE